MVDPAFDERRGQAGPFSALPASLVRFNHRFQKDAGVQAEGLTAAIASLAPRRIVSWTGPSPAGVVKPRGPFTTSKVESMFMNAFDDERNA